MTRGNRRSGLEPAFARIAGWLLVSVLFAVLGGSAGCVSSKGCPDNPDLASGACAADSGMRHDASQGMQANDAGGGAVEDGGDDAEVDASGSSRDAGGGCDGGVATVCFDDRDEDGFALLGSIGHAVCADACPTKQTQREPTAGNSDCHDGAANEHPGASEQCNDRDDDCDTSVDESASQSCDYTDASGACVGGKCTLGACDEGYADCDAKDDNGCEQALDEDGNCGGCGVECHQLASCDASEPTGVCTCDAPSFGDGLDCRETGLVSAGAYYTCAIKADNSVTGWANSASLTTPPPPNAGFKRLAGGTAHTCGLKATGEVACWGNAGDQIMPPAGQFIDVAAGYVHTCGLKPNGTAVCWGPNPATGLDYGQGDPPIGAFRQLAAGGYHTCGLREDGTVECWGSGKTLAPGCGSTSEDCGQSVVPASTHRFVQITAGSWHTCGLKADGSVMCWGAGTTDTDAAPNYGQAAAPTGASFAYISAGSEHTCGVTTTGALVCWGAGDFDGDTGDHHRQAWPPSGKYLRVYAGSSHTCALSNQLALDCWGSNGQMQAPTSIPGTWPLIP